MKLVTLLSLALTLAGDALAGSATWSSHPATNDWNTASNWTPATVPIEREDVATFGTSDTTTVAISDLVGLAGITFESGAPAYTIDGTGDSLDFFGDGVVNNSGELQTFDFTGSFRSVTFFLDAVAGANTLYEVGPVQHFGRVTFYGFSSADHASFSNNSHVFFYQKSTAASGTFTNLPGSDMYFLDDSSLGDATITSLGSSPEGEGAIIYLRHRSTGKARIILLGDSLLDLSSHDLVVPAAVGSIEGEGNVSTGGRDLVVGGNDRSTVFTGQIDGNSNGTVTKTGRGNWTLTGGGQTYGGGTFVEGGRLIANNTSGSATGSGPVSVTRGTLGGKGFIAGAVTAGGGQAAEVSPGSRAERNVGSLTIQDAITFAAKSSYRFQLHSNRGSADLLHAAGVSIEGSARFVASDLGNSALGQGTSFVVVDNTAATPIAGTFSNLPDGGTIVIGSNVFLASYTGGDGNDLTLTVVP